MGDVVGVQTLTDWLLEQVAVDEQLAKNCGGAPWVDQVPGMVHVDPVAIREAKWQFGRMGYVATVEHDHDRAHIARWDPARVLVECDTKRRIIAAYLRTGEGPHPGKPCVNYEDQHPENYDEYDSCSRHLDAMQRRFSGDYLLRLLAAVYRDRPGYRADEWAPDGR